MAIVSGKYYRLTTQWTGDAKSLDLTNPGKEPCMANSGNYSGQFWKVTSLGNGYYRLTAKWTGDGKSLDLNNTTKQPRIADTGNYSGQNWKITSLNNGYYRLTTQWLGDAKALDLTNPGQKPCMADTKNVTGQFWKFTEVPDSIVSTAQPSPATSTTTTISTTPPPISDQGTIITEPDKTYKIKLTVTVPENIGFNNTFGIFAMADDESVAGVKPNDPNYAETVVKHRIELPGLDEGSYQRGDTFQCDLPGGPKYGIFLIANGTPAQFLEQNPTNEFKEITTPTAYFANAAANPDKISHVKKISSTEFGFEDLYGGGDQSFNDLIVKLETVS